jgi:hypothetical protein
MNPPDATYVRRRSRVDFTSLGFPPPPTVGDPDPLADEVADAIDYVRTVTWRPLDDTMPVELANMAARAVWLRTEQQVYLADPDASEGANDELTQSFSAGGYSETRRDPTRRGEQRSVNPNPDLDRLLWLVMTDEARAWWRAFLSGQMPPVAIPAGIGNVSEVAWNWTHFAPYEDVVDGETLRSTYMQPVDPGDLPWVPDPLGDT